MPKVHILPESIVSKIAAGEVIERPASVVKEIVENAIDAGSTSIELHLDDAGKTLIHIKDTGSGIAHDDLQNIFNRHATSKIQNEEDLFNILSLGFRGEALYTIAAISDVILRTRTQDSDCGWEIHLRGAQRISLKPCTFAGTGTEIEIREIFFNTPARKKFLKSDTAELTQILNTFIPYALLHPNVRFVLTHNNKTLIDLKPTSELTQRIAETLNVDAKDLLSTNQKISSAQITVQLIIGDINISRSRRDLQYIFVNERPVQNKNIAFHINQIARLIMPSESYPLFCVYLTVPAGDVDVNVHPTKREIKLREEQKICSILRGLTEQLLMQKGSLKMVSSKNANTTIDASEQPTIRRTYPTATEHVDMSPDSTINEAYGGQYAFPQIHATAQTIPAATFAANYAENFFIPDTSLVDTKKETLHQKLSQARFVGTFINKFLLFESGTSLLIVDQHAAQERIVYEQLIRQMNAHNVEIQPLLSPLIVQLTPIEMVAWEKFVDVFKTVGIDITQFDNESLAIHAHPRLLKDPQKAVQQILAGDSIDVSNFDTIARRACRASIMAGDKLAPEQAQHQRKQLLECLDPFTCPHGRPIVIEIPEKFLDKEFQRI